MSKQVHFYLVAITAAIWVACGSNQSTSPKIDNRPNNNKMTMDCPTQLGKFQDEKRMVIEIRPEQNGTLTVLQDDQIIAVTGSRHLLTDGTQVTATCVNGKISITQKNKVGSEPAEISILGGQMTFSSKAGVAKLSRIGPVVTSQKTNGLVNPKLSQKGRPTSATGSVAVSCGSTGLASPGSVLSCGSTGTAVGDPSKIDGADAPAAINKDGITPVEIKIDEVEAPK